MAKLLFRPCPICANKQGDILYSARFMLPDENPLTRKYDVVSCTHCSFAFADTLSTQNDYDLYYNTYSQYQDAATSTSSGASPADAARIRKQVEHIAAFLPDPHVAIADIGCANGGVLDGLKSIGYTNLTGIDPSAACIRNINAKGLSGMTGTFSHLPMPTTQFGVVLLTGVLEHVLDISNAIDALGHILAPSGIVYITVPDAGHYHEFLHAPFQDFSTEHINHFTVRSLNNLMVLKGYESVVSGQITLTAGTEPPFAFGVFKRTTVKQAFIPDEDLKAQLQLYIDASTFFMERLNQQWQAAFEQHKKLIIWGLGQLAFKLLELPATNQSKIAAFVDGNPVHQGLTLLEKTTLSPEQAAGMPYPILITTTLHAKPIVEVIRKKLAMTNEIILLH